MGKPQLGDVVPPFCPRGNCWHAEATSSVTSMYIQELKQMTCKMRGHKTDLLMRQLRSQRTCICAEHGELGTSPSFCRDNRLQREEKVFHQSCGFCELSVTHRYRMSSSWEEAMPAVFLVLPSKLKHLLFAICGLHAVFITEAQVLYFEYSSSNSCHLCGYLFSKILCC